MNEDNVISPKINEDEWFKVHRAQIAKGSSLTDVADFAEEDDCDRSVACVNALAGCPDPAKFVASIKELYNNIEDARVEIDCYCDDVSWLKDKS